MIVNYSLLIKSLYIVPARETVTYVSKYYVMIMYC